MCIINYYRLIFRTNRTPMAVITSFNQIKKLVLDRWGNEMYFAPIAMKFDPMAKNSKLLNMKPIIYINYSPFIHKSSIFYTSIQIH